MSFVSTAFVERRSAELGADMTVAGAPRPVSAPSAMDESSGRDAKRKERRAAGVACGAHALHDGYTDLIYIMLPLWQRDFGLGYAELGMLRGLYAGTMAGFQVPASYLAERFGPATVLALGTALAGLGYCLVGLSAGLGLLLVGLFISGLGASTQHPIASTLMARAYEGPRSLQAIGTYNFAGDLGKMTLPATASLLLIGMEWRPTLGLLGACGLAAAVAIYLLTPRYSAMPEGAAVTEGRPAAGTSCARRHAMPFRC